MSNLDIDILSDLINGGKAAIKKTEQEKEAQKRAKKAAAQRAKLRAQYSPVAVAMESNDFVPISQTAQIILQSCDECGSLTQFVGAVTLREKHKRLPAFREMSKPLDSNLPLEIRYHEQRVPFCACCLKTIERTGELVSAITSAKQLELF